MAVEYYTKYYIGKITEIESPVLDSEDLVSLTYISKTKKGKYKWPKREDTDKVSANVIFCTKVNLREEESDFFVDNEDFVTQQFQNYKNDLNN